MNADRDPLIVSISGSLTLPERVISAFRRGDLESEGAFACFAATAHSLVHGTADAMQIEPHEGFWGAHPGLGSDQVSGELGWFQTGIYSMKTYPLPVSLLVHAATRSVEQLGELTLEGVRLQIPTAHYALGDSTRQDLLDQFTGLADVRRHTTAVVRVFFAETVDRWAECARDWFAQTYIFPFVAVSVSSDTGEEHFDNRWFVRDTKGIGTVTFDTPEWSPAAAAALVLLVLETLQSARIDRAVIVEVARR